MHGVVELWTMDATSERGLFGSLIPPSWGGEWEPRLRGKLWATGELNEVVGAEREEYRDTGERQMEKASGQQTHAWGGSAIVRNTPLSSQSLAPLPERTEEAEDTELRLSLARPNSAGSFLTMAIFCCLGLVMGLEGLRVFDLERNSSNLRGRGRKWVRSYKPHLLQTIFPGLRVERRQEGGSVVWQLKQRRRRYWVSFEAASSVCCTGRLLWGGGRYGIGIWWQGRGDL